MYEFLRNLLKEHNITFEITQDAKELLATRGFNPIYGARPLKRAIQTNIEDMLSEKLLDSSIKKGDKVKVTYKDGQYIVE